jgi:rod shape determining protein RodA
MHDTPINERKHEYEWPLAAAVLGLMIIGTAFIFSATESQSFYLHQVLWYVLGVGAAAALCYFEYGSLARWSAVFYWGAMVLLLAVYPAGAAHHGAKRWLFGLQPSEFAKIAFILWLAHYLSRPPEELRRGKVFLGALGYTLLPFILVLKEPDMGSALVFLAISLAMMFVAGVPNRLLGGLVAGAGLLVVLGVALILFAPVKLKILESYQSGRVLEYFGRRRSWRQGTQHALGFLPSGGAHNDFIFSVIAEEEGFVGSVVILTLYAVLLFSGIKIASQARDRLGQIMAMGVVTLLFSHVFINIGMNIRLMPVAGIPLPLLSYGGSSVICSLIAIGILHNVHIYRRYH